MLYLRYEANTKELDEWDTGSGSPAQAGIVLKASVYLATLGVHWVSGTIILLPLMMVKLITL
jgi:hypothetical protein